MKKCYLMFAALVMLVSCWTGNLPNLADELVVIEETPLGSDALTNSEMSANNEALTNGETPTYGEAPTNGEMPTNSETLTNDEAPTNGEMPINGEAPTSNTAPEDSAIYADITPVVFLGIRTDGEGVIEFDFSKPVTVKELNFEPAFSIAALKNGTTVKVTLNESIPLGIQIKAVLIAEDENKNLVNISETLFIENNKAPELTLNELCNISLIDGGAAIAEFIELKIKSRGNLGAVRVFITENSSATKQTVYQFPSVEVQKDDYVVLHLRTTHPDSVNECGNNLAESGGHNSSPAARDFWVPGDEKLLDKNSIVYVLDQDDKILSAVMISENPGSPYPNSFLNKAAAFLLEQGAWTGNPVDSKASTNTRTICRDENLTVSSKSSADWYITAIKCKTPGTVNNPTR
ncbi:MAG: hypothetical protein FWC06_04620 [Treponema sp.]|nr:hypothetical protein [Treponema sp.]